jgi:hypothetical protein
MYRYYEYGSDTHCRQIYGDKAIYDAEYFPEYPSDDNRHFKFKGGSKYSKTEMILDSTIFEE